MSVACLLITDGRPYLQETLRSAEEFLFPYIDGPTVLVSDSSHKLGLSGAIREGWERLRLVRCSYAFHLEDDFVFRAPVPVDEMVALLEREKLWQVALKRGPVNDLEHAHGGFMQANPHNYEQRAGWVESHFGFTFNPCVYRNPIHPLVMPEWAGEAGLTEQLRGWEAVPNQKYDYARYGIFGSIEDPPRCTHIGHERAAGWTL